MRRRELLRLLSAATVVPVISPELFAMLRQAQPASGYALQTLDAHQNETVLAMIDLIIPATDTPGAKGAKVNEFIDVVLTDWATPVERQHFLEGLAVVDAQSQELFFRNFTEAVPEQQATLLQSMDDSVDWAHAPARIDDSMSGEFDRQLQGEFFRVFKTITLQGYYTSEIGFTQELKLEIIPGAQHGCVPVSPEKKA